MKRNTFTLIEILGVMVVIAILATIGFAGYSYANNKSKESATKGLITRLNAAFEYAHQKSGFMPPSGNNYVQLGVTNETVTVGSDVISVNADDNQHLTGGTNPRTRKMYAEFCKNFIQSLQMDSMSRFIENGVIIDAWGNPVYYRYPGVLKTGGFDLIAAGSDGGFGSGTVNTPTATVSDYRDGNDWICDDIANF